MAINLQSPVGFDLTKDRKNVQVVFRWKLTLFSPGFPSKMSSDYCGSILKCWKRQDCKNLHHCREKLTSILNALNVILKSLQSVFAFRHWNRSWLTSSTRKCAPLQWFKKKRLEVMILIRQGDVNRPNCQMHWPGCSSRSNAIEILWWYNYHTIEILESVIPLHEKQTMPRSWQVLILIIPLWQRLSAWHVESSTS